MHFTDNESRTYMIGLLIQDNAYEQDIRELLMSFYPGETYAHEVKDELEFYVETKLGQGEISVLIWDRDGGRDGMDQGGAAALPAGQGPEEGNPVSWKLSVSRTGASDLSDHSATKNVVKKNVLPDAYGAHGNRATLGVPHRNPSHQDCPYQAGGGLG